MHWGKQVISLVAEQQWLTLYFKSVLTLVQKTATRTATNTRLIILFSNLLVGTHYCSTDIIADIIAKCSEASIGDARFSKTTRATLLALHVTLQSVPIGNSYSCCQETSLVRTVVLNYSRIQNITLFRSLFSCSSPLRREIPAI